MILRKEPFVIFSYILLAILCFLLALALFLLLPLKRPEQHARIVNSQYSASAGTEWWPNLPKVHS